MKIARIIPIIGLLLVSCSEPAEETGKTFFNWNIATRVTGADKIDGINFEEAPDWGLYAYTPEGDVIFANARMGQGSNEGYSTDAYKTSTFMDGRPENMETLGGVILSAYYPHCDSLIYTFDPMSTDISPRLTLNSLGHPAIHYGIPNYRLGRHPKGGVNGLFDYGVGANPRYSRPARGVTLHTGYKHISAEELTEGIAKVELRPTTCRAAFVFSLAPRFKPDGTLEEIQADSTDYEIISVRRLRWGHVQDTTVYAYSTFNYDLLTGKIIDMKFCTEGLYFRFPQEGEPGYNPAWGPVNPYKFDTPDANKISCVEFVTFPTVFDDLQNIIFEVIYRYRLIRAEDPAVDEDIWVESKCRFNASSTYLVQGWESGKTYRYHIFISRHEVDYEVEVVPWDFQAEDDQFFGDIQV